MHSFLGPVKKNLVLKGHICFKCIYLALLSPLKTIRQLKQNVSFWWLQSRIQGYVFNEKCASWLHFTSIRLNSDNTFKQNSCLFMFCVLSCQFQMCFFVFQQLAWIIIIVTYLTLNYLCDICIEHFAMLTTIYIVKKMQTNLCFNKD